MTDGDVESPGTVEALPALDVRFKEGLRVVGEVDEGAFVY
jgi:hypothetical protein